METSSPYRPRVSRETRLLLIAGVMAVSILLPIIVRRPRREDSGKTIGLTPHLAQPRD